MKIVIGAYLFLVAQLALSQTKPAPFAESGKAIAALEKETLAFDSLRKVYKKRFLLGLSYGQRFLLNSDISVLPDTITNVDFTDRRSFYGIGTSYFINDRWSVGMEFNISILPRDQEIRGITIGGGNISGSGSGDGGLAVNIGINARYYFVKQDHFRPYVGLHFGTTNLTAKGGEVSFSLSSGREEETVTLTSNLRTGQLLAGVGYRASPGFILDYNVGLTKTSRTNLIGGVTSYGGITTSLTMQFVLNHKNN